VYLARLANSSVPASSEPPNGPAQEAQATLPPDAPPARPPQPNPIDTLRAAPVATLIIAVNVIVFLLAERSGNTHQSETLLRFGAVWRGLVWQGEYWRLATSMFLHIGALHLVWNGYYGFLLSTQVERAIGSARFTALYLMSGIAGAAASVIGHNAVAAGASGALFGLIGWQIATLRARFGSFRAMWAKPEVRRQLSWIGAWFVLGAFAGFDNYAHGGGLAFGVLFTWALLARPERRNARLMVALLAFAALVGLSLQPLPVIHAKELAQWKAFRAQHHPAE